MIFLLMGEFPVVLDEELVNFWWSPFHLLVRVMTKVESVFGCVVGIDTDDFLRDVFTEVLYSVLLVLFVVDPRKPMPLK